MREQAIALPPTLAAIIGAPKAPLSTIYAVRDRLITELDLIDGDADLEETDAEDSFVLSLWARASELDAGCPISDPGGCEHDGREPEDSH